MLHNTTQQNKTQVQVHEKDNITEHNITKHNKTQHNTTQHNTTKDTKQHNTTPQHIIINIQYEIIIQKTTQYITTQ